MKQPYFIHRADGSVPADTFIWHAVTHAVGNVNNQDPALIEAVR
ncbi:hypothetical protein L462_00969 [Enterobacter sp. BIDMC 26]|nr:hypothetical protein L462_00969 [Enterobacter sp. BIDMC 26]